MAFSSAAGRSLVLVTVLVTFAGVANAQDATRAHAPADALFSEGRDLLEKGRFAEACAKLARSEELAPAVGTLLNLGYCYEQLGKFRSAMDAYAEAEVLANVANEPKRATFARERFTAVEPRTAKLVVRIVPPEAPGLEVKRNGIVIAKTNFDHPIPIDPEDYVISASAPGYVPWQSAIIIKGEAAVVTVIIPPLVSASTATAGAAPSRLGSRRIMALGLGAVSALAIGAGVAAAFSAKSRYDDAQSHCDASSCDEVGASIQHGAVVEGNIATGLIGFGALCGAAGIYLWIVGAPEAKQNPRAVRLDVGPRGAMLGGRF